MVSLTPAARLPVSSLDRWLVTEYPKKKSQSVTNARNHTSGRRFQHQVWRATVASRFVHDSPAHAGLRFSRARKRQCECFLPSTHLCNTFRASPVAPGRAARRDPFVNKADPLRLTFRRCFANCRGIPSVIICVSGRS